MHEVRGKVIQYRRRPVKKRVRNIIGRCVIVCCLCGVMVWSCTLWAHAARKEIHPTSSSQQVELLRDGAYFPRLIAMIDRAGSEIVMSFFLFKTNGYAENYPDIVLSHLMRAATRNVDVTVILEKGRDPASQVDRNNRETARRMKEGGIRVCFDSPHTTTHTKAVVIDRRYVFIGSHNMTASALKYNHEVSVVVDSTVLADKMLRYMNTLYK